MDREELLQYRRTLLRGGLQLGVVERNVRELQDHFNELKQQARLQGWAETEADLRARQALGELPLLAKDMLASSRKSLLYRYPALLTIVLPSAGLVLLCIFSALTLLAAVRISGISEAASAGAMPVPAWLIMLYQNLKLLLMLSTPLILLYLITIGVRSYLPARYWAVGVLLLALLGSGLDFDIRWPDPDNEGQHGGSFGFSLGYASLFAANPDPASRNTLELMATLMLAGLYGRYLGLRQEGKPAEGI